MPLRCAPGCASLPPHHGCWRIDMPVPGGANARRVVRLTWLATIVAVLSLAATGAAAAGTPRGVVALPGYSVTTFVQGTRSWTNPDAIVVASGHVFIAYQNQS